MMEWHHFTLRKMPCGYWDGECPLCDWLALVMGHHCYYGGECDEWWKNGFVSSSRYFLFSSVFWPYWALPGHLGQRRQVYDLTVSPAPLTVMADDFAILFKAFQPPLPSSALVGWGREMPFPGRTLLRPLLHSRS